MGEGGYYLKKYRMKLSKVLRTFYMELNNDCDIDGDYIIKIN